MIIVVAKGIKREEIDLPIDTSISEVFKYSNIKILSHQVVCSAGKIIDPSCFNDSGTHNGRITIASSTRSEAPTPKVKNVIKYLKKRGYEKVSGGKGDHIKFRGENREIIVLNPDNHDKKHLDLGSAKSLAKKLNMNLTELNKEI